MYEYDAFDEQFKESFFVSDSADGMDASPKKPNSNIEALLAGSEKSAISANELEKVIEIINDKNMKYSIDDIEKKITENTEFLKSAEVDKKKDDASVEPCPDFDSASSEKPNDVKASNTSRHESDGYFPNDFEYDSSEAHTTKSTREKENINENVRSEPEAAKETVNDIKPVQKTSQQKVTEPNVQQEKQTPKSIAKEKQSNANQKKETSPKITPKKRVKPKKLSSLTNRTDYSKDSSKLDTQSAHENGLKPTAVDQYGEFREMHSVSPTSKHFFPHESNDSVAGVSRRLLSLMTSFAMFGKSRIGASITEPAAQLSGVFMRMRDKFQMHVSSALAERRKPENIRINKLLNQKKYLSRRKEKAIEFNRQIKSRLRIIDRQFREPRHNQDPQSDVRALSYQLKKAIQKMQNIHKEVEFLQLENSQLNQRISEITSKDEEKYGMNVSEIRQKNAKEEIEFAETHKIHVTNVKKAQQQIDELREIVGRLVKRKADAENRVNIIVKHNRSFAATFGNRRAL